MRMTRRGHSLVELLVALTVTAFLASATFRLVDRTQRFAMGTALVTDQRGQLAAASFAIASSLEGISAVDGDLLAVSDSAVAYLGAVGEAVACALTPAAIDVPPPLLASGATLTWWNGAPQSGDQLMLFDEGPLPGALDDGWWHGTVAAVAPLPNACLGTPYVHPVADAGKRGWRITTTSPPPSTVVAGAALRVRRPERFALYRSAGEWMLGWTEHNASSGTWNIIQPVAGPLLPYTAAAGTPSGLRFAWLDSAGLATSMRQSVRTVRLVIAAPTRRAQHMDGTRGGFHEDSATGLLPMRNAR
ncbi:MAG: prepilin-type N-terminal cleavage/methylation domain-containing protein [Gemmatimonadaceae bacterium]